MNTQENQTLSAEEIALIVAEVLRNMSQPASLQTPTTETSRPEIINFQDIVQKNKQPAPPTPQGASVPTTAAGVDVTTSQTLSNTAPAAKNESDSTVPPQPKQKAQSGSQLEAAQSSTSTLTRPVFDEDKILPVFRKELGEIFDLGTRLDQIEKKYQEKGQDKAIKALAKLLGVRRKYFDDITPEVGKVLFEDLYQQCKNHGLKGRTKRTTEFHLLSRLYRQSDRKQASADAKILIRAHNEEQTAATFAGWVKGLGGLNSILKGITDYERDQKKTEKDQQRTKNKHKGNLKALFDVAREASWMPNTSFEVEKVPDKLRELIPSEGRWLPLVIGHKNGKVTFYIPKKDACPTELPPDLAEETGVDNPSATEDAENNQESEAT